VMEGLVSPRSMATRTTSIACLFLALGTVRGRLDAGEASRLERVRGFDYSCIARGQAFVAPGWLKDDELLHALQIDVRSLIDTFVDTDELLGKRLKLDLATRDWSAPDESAPSEARAAARRLLDALRVELENTVGRRLYLDELGSQAKFTIGHVGEPVLRHTDQRHEAFGSRYFSPLEQTRRSVAWLLYLCDESWDEPGGSGSGGTLRAFPRRDCAGDVGVHDGNQQVGWLERGQGAEPIFLDSWVVPDWMEGSTLADLRREWAHGYSEEEELWSALYQVQPSYVLYCVGANGARENVSQIHASPQKDEHGDYVKHVPSLLEMLPMELRAGFSSMVDEHAMQQPVEVSPKGGTLVVFDTRSVPHEVDAVIAGQRLLLFGFFAEDRPVPLAWVDHDAQSICGPWFHEGWAHEDDLD